MNTKEFFEKLDSKYIDENSRNAFLSVISSKGKNKGYILANPPKDNDRKIAWYALIGQLAPVRLSIGFLMFASTEDKEQYNKLDKVATTLKTCLNAVEPAFRWNLWAMHHDSKVFIEHMNNKGIFK